MDRKLYSDLYEGESEHRNYLHPFAKVDYSKDFKYKMKRVVSSVPEGILVLLQRGQT